MEMSKDTKSKIKYMALLQNKYVPTKFSCSKIQPQAPKVSGVFLVATLMNIVAAFLEQVGRIRHEKQRKFRKQIVSLAHCFTVIRMTFHLRFINRNVIALAI